MDTFDHPVWRCTNPECGRLFHEEPVPTEPVWGKNKHGYSVQIIRSVTLCHACGGDIRRAWDLIPLAKSVRPIPPIKGQDFQMWRYCCWNCGKGSDVAYGTRSHHWLRPWNGFNTTPPSWLNTTCHLCGKENRLAFPGR